jgi:hypothetical protein
MIVTSVKNPLNVFKKFKKIFPKDPKPFLKKNSGLMGWAWLMSECSHGPQKDE